MKQLLAALLLMTVTVAPAGTAAAPSLQAGLRGVLQAYLKERGSIEHITAASVSIERSAGDPQVLAAAGSSPSSLFQIGSNTKAFTAVLALQLEAAGKLSIDEPIGRWLPQYPAWKNITIRRLLHMVGGLPTYDNELAFQKDYAAQPYRNFSTAQLIAYVYPKAGLRGWNYSNTGYLLTQLIIERVTGRSYGEVLRSRIFQRLGLRDTYYYSGTVPASVRDRVVDGYFASNDADNKGLAPIYDKNVRDYTLSWTQGAGGIISTPADVTRWARALYSGALLPAKQQAQLTTLVSTESGRRIASTSATNPRGFGLGVAQLMRPKIGRIWYYEGETLGYRVLHALMPDGTIITVALNSQPPAKDDKIHDLMTRCLAVLPK
jgi:D-alanyl-D-alanine carboxypeptidase